MSSKTCFEKEPFTSRSNILQKITLKSMSREEINVVFSVTQVVNALMNSIVPSTNQVLPLLEQLTQRTCDEGKLLQSPYFFRPFTPTPLTPPPLPTGILYSSQFHLHQESKMTTRRTQRSTSTILRKNRGL